MATVEVCGNAEWWRVYGGLDGVNLEAINDYTSDLYAALRDAGHEPERPHGQRSLCHGWNGANTFRRKYGGIGTFDAVTDAEWSAIVAVVDAVEQPEEDEQ